MFQMEMETSALRSSKIGSLIGDKTQMINSMTDQRELDAA